MVTNKQIRFLIKQWEIDVIIDIRDRFFFSYLLVQPKAQSFRDEIALQKEGSANFS